MYLSLEVSVMQLKMISFEKVASGKLHSLYILLDYFTTRPSFKKTEHSFFDQVVIDAKNV